MRTIVIGGGLAGLSAACALIQRGQSVTVLEAREGVALETSFANAGMLTPSMPEPWNGPGVMRDLFAALFNPRASMKVHLHAIPSLFFWGLEFLCNAREKRYLQATIDNYRLCRYSKEKTLEIARELNLEFDLAERGTLCTFKDAHHFTSRRELCETLAAFGLNWRELSVPEVVELEPTLEPISDQLLGGIWLPDDARGDAHLYCRGLAKAIEASGSDIQTDAAVIKLITNGNAIRGVETRAGILEVDNVVVACGERMPMLLQTAGLDAPIRPAKGYSLTIDTERLGQLPNVSVVDDLTHSVVNVYGSRLRIVGTAEFTGFDKKPSSVRIENTFNDFAAVFPQIATRVDRELLRPWAGLRPMSSDGRPFIGPTGISGLFVNGGHGPLGWSMAAGSGSLLADLLLNRSPEIDAGPFRFNR
ncbi:MAG: FAD-dependent oxidoreductase [Woeseia sp.]|jgi:D-amino-acid dehydrogenase|nr:FAD-dependent oxidoreductase [Woeseia sp.]MBT6208853.1 FAD-dependent oxidoreductase [Woeseia sp.]